VTVALSVTIRPQFTIECLRPTLKSTGGGSLWAQISGCFPWSRSIMFGFAESERPTLTNREIIFEEFQVPTYVITIHQRHRQTDGQTTCDRKTALCTLVHRAVKTVIWAASLMSCWLLWQPDAVHLLQSLYMCCILLLHVGYTMTNKL